MAGDRQNALENVGKLEDVVSDADGDNNFEALQTGAASTDKEFQEVAESDLQKAEIFGVPVALLVLILVFGALVSAVIPVFLAFIAIGVAIAIAALVGQVSPLSFFVTNMVTMMGLAVGIDYSLFVISRFREERANGAPKLTAILTTGATANRAILFSGMTVILALMGLLIVPMNVFRSLSLGAIFVVIIAVLAALTFLPAILSILGDRVNFLRLPIIGKENQTINQRGFWYRLTQFVMSRPVISLVVAAVILLVAAIPAFRINTGAAGVASLPDNLDSKKAFTILQEDFSGTFESPIKITVDGDVNELEVLKSIARLQNNLKEVEIFGASSVERNGQGDLALITVPVKVDPTDPEALDEVEKIRNDYVPEAFQDTTAEVLVGGGTSKEFRFYSDCPRVYYPRFYFRLESEFCFAYFGL
jgi:RND superfamily putative drug exporter